MSNKAITEFTLDTPSTNASVLGEDNGTVKRFSVSSFGGGGGIIDVTELPTENIDTNAIYRILEEEISSLDCYLDGVKVEENFTFLIVDVLPEIGTPCVDVEAFQSSGTIVQTVYYNTQDGKIYAYIDDVVSAFLEGTITTTGWISAEEAWGEMYGGVFNSFDEVPEAQFMFFVVANKGKKSKLYSYYNNGTEIVQTRIVTSENFEFNATTGTLVLNL